MVKRCAKCGTEYPDSDSFCIECGEKLKPVARPRPAKSRTIIRTEIPEELEADVSRLHDSLMGVEDEIAGLREEIKGLKSEEPPEDLELLKSAVEGNAKRTQSISSKLKTVSAGLKEREKHIEGIENIIAGLARKQDIEELNKDISVKFGQRTRAQNERLEELETEVRGQLSSLSTQFSQEFKSQVNSAAKRVEGLEARLQGLLTGLEKTTESKLEGFKTGFNQKVNKSMLDLRKEVAQKTSIVNKLKQDLENQIRLNQDRYAGFEARLNKELEDLDNLKEGLAVQQEGKMKEFQTLLLERIGEMKDHSKTIGGDIEKRLRLELSGGMQANAKRIASLKALESRNGKQIRKMERLEEDMVLHQQNRALVLEDRISKALENMKQESQAFVSGLEERIGSGIKLNAGEIAGLKRRLERFSALGAGIEKRLLETDNIRKEIGKLEEDLVLQQQGKLMALESRVASSVEGLKAEAEKNIGDAAAKAAGDIDKRLAEVRELSIKLERLSAIEKGIAGRVSELKGLRKRVGGIKARVEANNRVIAGLRARMDKGLGKGLEKRIEAIEAFRLESRQQMDLMKEFLENLEKRIGLETESLEKKLDGVSRIQEKQELEILTPENKNINRIIKNQVKNEVGVLEKRILSRLKSKAT